MAATVGGGASHAGASRNWSELPVDILVLILRRLTIVDYIRFGAVCTAWNSLAKSKLCRPAPQNPWLMFPASDDDGRGGCDYQSLLDVSTDKTYTLYLPELRGRQCIGTSADGGWVVFVREDLELGMINIFAGQQQQQQLTLPPLATLWDLKGVVLDEKGQVADYRVQVMENTNLPCVEVSPEWMSQAFYHKTLVFLITTSTAGESTSTTTTTPAVALIHGSFGSVSVARPGDRAWKKLDTPFGIKDVAFHGSRLYAVEYGGDTFAFDLCCPSSFTWSDAKPLWSPPVHDHDLNAPYKYLVPLVSGHGEDDDDDVIHVWRFQEYAFDPETNRRTVHRTSQVQAFRLDPVSYEWVELQSLGGCTFFLGHNFPVVLSDAQKFPRLRRDCIYFTESPLGQKLRDEDFRHGSPDVGVFSFEEGTWDALPLPGAIVRFPSPIWVNPSLV